MKKRTSLLVLLLVVALLLCACGNKAKIESELMGTYVASTEFWRSTYTFKADGTYSHSFRNVLDQSTSTTGTYTIGKDEITLDSDDGIDEQFTYTYNSDNGTLVLYANGNAYTKK